MTTPLKQDLGALACCGLLFLVVPYVGFFVTLLVWVMMCDNWANGLYRRNNDRR